MAKSQNNALIRFVKAAIKAGSYSRKEYQKASELLADAAIGGPCCVNDISFSRTGDSPSHCNYFSSITPANPDNDTAFTHYMKFIGQSGQGSFIVDIPFEEAPEFPGAGIYRVPDNGVITLPPSLSGMYKVVLSLSASSDYPGVNFIDDQGEIIQTEGSDAPLVSGIGPAITTNAFDIERLKEFRFTGVCGG